MSELIEAHEAHLRAAGYSPHTIDQRTRWLRRLHDHLPYGIAYADPAELEAFIGQDGWGQWTRCTATMHIRAAYRWWVQAGYLETDPAVHVARPRHPKSLPDPVTDQELAHALAASGEPWYTAILLAAANGLRAGEIAGLHREHITEVNTRIVRGKGGDPRSVDTHPLVWGHLKDRPPGPVISGPGLGRPPTGAGLSRRARTHFDSIGLPQVHLHRFRHWHATALLDMATELHGCEVSLRLVQESMGHASVASTQGYTAVRSGQRRRAIAALPIPTGTQKSTEQ